MDNPETSYSIIEYVDTHAQSSQIEDQFPKIKNVFSNKGYLNLDQYSDMDQIMMNDKIKEREAIGRVFEKC